MPTGKRILVTFGIAGAVVLAIVAALRILVTFGIAGAVVPAIVAALWVSDFFFYDEAAENRAIRDQQHIGLMAEALVPALETVQRGTAHRPGPLRELGLVKGPLRRRPGPEKQETKPSRV